MSLHGSDVRRFYVLHFEMIFRLCGVGFLLAVRWSQFISQMSFSAAFGCFLNLLWGERLLTAFGNAFVMTALYVVQEHAPFFMFVACVSQNVPGVLAFLHCLCLEHGVNCQIHSCSPERMASLQLWGKSSSCVIAGVVPADVPIRVASLYR